MKNVNNEEQKTIIRKERKKGIIFSILCSVITFVLGISLAGKFGVTNNNVDEDLENLIYYYNILKNEWYFGDDEVTEEALKAAIDAIYKSNKDVDPYTYFTQAPIIIDNDNNTPPTPPEPTKYGIGISSYLSVDEDNNINGDGIIVSEVYRNGGSYNYLKIGDQILGCYVGDEYLSFVGKKYVDIEGYIKTTEENSELKLHIKRGIEELDIIVVRKSYSSNYIFENIVDENICPTCVGVRITQFTNSSSMEFKDVMDSIIEREKQQGTKSENLDLILDLRDNPGGLVTSFTNIADYFLPKGLDLLYYEYKDKHISIGGVSMSDVRYKFNSISILVNGNTASASEGLTLALVDYSKYLNNKVQVIGEKSFGKGIAQNEVPLPDGSSIRYTFARTLSPNKYSIHGIGIIPDVEIALEPYSNALGKVNNWIKQFNDACFSAHHFGGTNNGK